MLCSNCQEEIKPVVAIDIDGTLGDYHAHFLSFAMQYLQRRVPLDYDGKESFKDWFLESTELPERSWQDVKLAYRQGGLKRSMPLFTGAHFLCEMIRDSGAELWLTTTRPYLRLDNIDPDTRFWLDNHGIKYDALIYGKDKYETLFLRVDSERVVAVVDDLPYMYDQASRYFGWRTPILRRTKWNSGIPCAQAESDLYEVARQIKVRIIEWKEQHEISTSVGS